ncbi:MAG: DUF2188 domain-containing protein [Candidatus Helarchaeota archaeon]
MGKKNQHVVPDDKGWAGKGEGNKRNTAITPTKKEAEQIARNIAKNQRSELFIHERNGKIQDRDSYGSDPCPPKDNKH